MEDAPDDSETTCWDYETEDVVEDETTFREDVPKEDKDDGVFCFSATKYDNACTLMCIIVHKDAAPRGPRGRRRTREPIIT